MTAPPASAPSQGAAVTAGILSEIRRIEPQLVGRIPEFDAERRIPASVIGTLRDIGVFDLLAPLSHGGAQAGLLNSILVLEELARIDASLAWTTMIGMESPQILALLPRESYDELFLGGRRPLQGGTFMPAGKARRVEGGFLVSGRWGFASGCQNWSHLFGNCIVVDENGEALPGKAPGTSLTCTMVFPASEVVIEDTWRTLGMRGTGSHHFRAEEVFVPDRFSLDMVFGRPCVEGVSPFPIADFNLHIAAVILGTARGAVEEFRRAAQTKRRVSQTLPAARNPLVQDRVGRIEADLRAARAYLHETARFVEGLTGEERFADINLHHIGPQNAWMARTAAGVVDEVWALSGASEAAESSPIQRRLRDISVERQHAAVSDVAFAAVGAALFGEVYEVRQQTQHVPEKS